MSETYKIYTPNGIAVKVDKETNKIYFQEMLKQRAIIPKNIPKLSSKVTAY